MVVCVATPRDRASIVLFGGQLLPLWRENPVHPKAPMRLNPTWKFDLDGSARLMTHDGRYKSAFLTQVCCSIVHRIVNRRKNARSGKQCSGT